MLVDAEEATFRELFIVINSIYRSSVYVLCIYPRGNLMSRKPGLHDCRDGLR